MTSQTGEENQNLHGSGAQQTAEIAGEILGISMPLERSRSLNRVIESPQGYRIGTPPIINSDDVSSMSQPSGISDAGNPLPMGSAVVAGMASVLGGGPYGERGGGGGKGRSSSPGLIRPSGSNQARVFSEPPLLPDPPKVHADLKTDEKEALTVLCMTSAGMD